MPVKQAIPQEFCLKCLGCCRFSQKESVWSPHLLEDEKNAIGRIVLAENPQEGNFICGHLNKPDNKCRIYAHRPFECRVYPFLFDRKNDQLFLALDLNCAYVKENKGNPQFKQHIRSLIEFIQTEEILDILRKNPQLFQDYGEVYDLVELKI